MAFYSLSEDTLKIPLEMHANNRKKLLGKLRKRDDVPDGSFVVLEGGKQMSLNSSDAEVVFRQESYFFWTFGVTDADFYGAICVETGCSILFAPLLHESYSIWHGKIHDTNHFKKRYGVDDVYFYTSEGEEIANVLKKKGAKKLLSLYGLNTDSDLYTTAATFPGVEKFEVDKKILHGELAECRVHKSEDEIAVIAYANKISSEAHKELMRKVRPGWHEYQAESLFQHYCYSNGGMRHCAYTCIGATGCHCAILHYGHAGAPNNRKILDGDMALFDMGGEYFCYASDITCSFPVNGKFTEKQRLVYETVLDSNRTVMAAAKPGVTWVDMHRLAEKRVLAGLAKGGVLRSAHGHTGIDDDELNEMVEARLGAVFMPHGLGHFMGLDVHDVNGYPAEMPDITRLPYPGLRSLRTARVLEPNMVLTIEPGCYFIDPVLDKALADDKFSRWLVKERLADFRGSGGVRIEDDCVVRESGIELLTDVPRTVKEIEDFMACGSCNGSSNKCH